MKVNVTNLYGMAQSSVAQLAQNEFVRNLKSMDINELSIYWYNFMKASKVERDGRFAGMLASLQFGDIVIFQLPTWIVWNTSWRTLKSFVATASRLPFSSRT